MRGEHVGLRLGGLAAGDAEAERALLGRAHALLEPAVRGHVAAFYARLERRPGPAQVLARLTDVERARLQDRQAEHVLSVVHPDTTHADLVDGGRAMGRAHARAGVEMDWYVDAVTEHQRDVYRALLPHRQWLDCAATTALLNERFMVDLHGTLQGYREVDREEHDAMVRVIRAASDARTVADLSREVMEALAGLDGMAVVLLGRPDEDGVFVFEDGAGAAAEEFLAQAQLPGALSVTASPALDQGNGPSGRAWRTGEVVRCDDYRTDPTTAPWREWSLRWGWRASAAVPLRGSAGRPIALLSLYSPHPGYFSYPSRQALVDQLQQVVEHAFAELQTTPSVASDVRAYADRVRYHRLLRAGGLDMHYQPVVDLRTGRLEKLEALARLRDGDRMYLPGDFLPALGDDELLLLFRSGLGQAVDALAALDEAGVHTSVSVNLPAASATDGRYVTAVAAALADRTVEPDRVTLELLETGDVVGTLAERQRAMDRFKQLGVRLAQDDLGSGYSSLLRLRHFPFDEVKIDKNLVRGTDASPRAALHFVQPITDIAHSLGMTVVLEGLESDGLVEAALQLGVDNGQGFALARPMPLAAVPDWVRGFDLDLDRDRPRTHLGALAAHVSWEHQATALRGDPDRDALAASLTCPLTRYIADRQDAVHLARAHHRVHDEVLARRGSAGHRAAWESLVSMLGGG